MSEMMDKTVSRRQALRVVITVGGAGIALPTLTTLQGCAEEPARRLSDYSDLIAAVCDEIIPQTDTPGALAAEVPTYIEAVVATFFTPKQRAHFVNGLKTFDDLAGKAGATAFAAAEASTKHAILQSMDSGDVSPSAKESWQSLRDMTVFGYYTSEVATQELAFEEIPGRYIGCMPFSDVGRAWLHRGV